MVEMFKEEVMSYTMWAILAMVSYGVTAVFLKVSLRHFPPEVALVITNSILVATGFGIMVFRGQSITGYVGLSWPTLAVLLAGVTLSLSIFSYYMALSRGPASAVVPIFAMSFAVASVLSIVFLGEAVKVTRLIGMALAMVSVVLLTR